MTFWAKKDDTLDLIYQASVSAGRIRGSINVRDATGRVSDYRVQQANRDQTVTRIGTRVNGPKIFAPGEVVGGGITGVFAGLKRGQFYATLVLQRENEDDLPLAKGYVYPQNRVGIGEFAEPWGGRGFKENRAVADDVAPADIQETLAATNALRRIDGFIWYYHCSGDIANRLLRVTFRDVGDGLPTGMTSGANTTVGTWPSAAVITLTADQEGVIYVNAAEGKIGYAISIDNGTPTFEDPTTNPDPFPYWANEDDVGELFFDVTDEEAADRHSIYIIQEEWIAP